MYLEVSKSKLLYAYKADYSQVDIKNGFKTGKIINCSPDSIKINPIEYFWNVIKRELYEKGKFHPSKEYIWKN